MSGEGVATERRKAEFKVEVKSEDDLIVLRGQPSNPI
jgi:hypothetical protein